jgi:hypothetical protein
MVKISPVPIKKLLWFPLRTRHDAGQLLLVSVLLTGLQIAFFPLALVLDAGYSMQVARAILLEGAEPNLPLTLDWQAIFRDGLRRCGLWFLFLLPGGGLGTVVSLIAVLAAWQSGMAPDQLAWIYALLVFGLSFAGLLCLLGVELANLATMHMLLSGSFPTAFAFRAWLPVLRARFVAFELTELAFFLSGMLLLGLTLAALLPASLICIGPPILFAFGSTYLRLVSAAATALIYRDGLSSIVTRAQG